MTKLFTLSEKKVQNVLEHAKVKLVEKSYGSRFPSTMKYPRKRVTRQRRCWCWENITWKNHPITGQEKKREMLRLEHHYMSFDEY